RVGDDVAAAAAQLRAAAGRDQRPPALARQRRRARARRSAGPRPLDLRRPRLDAAARDADLHLVGGGLLPLADRDLRDLPDRLAVRPGSADPRRRPDGAVQRAAVRLERHDRAGRAAAGARRPGRLPPLVAGHDPARRRRRLCRGLLALRRRGLGGRVLGRLPLGAAVSEHSSIWPVVCGGGIALLAFGVLTSLLFSAAGALLLVWGLVGWVGEVRHG